MGTSADRSAGRGGNWTPLKLATNSYVRGIGSVNSADRARRVLARHVPLLGGAGAAASSARAGSAGVQRLGALLSGLSGVGVEPTLQSLGLARLVGQDRFLVLDELVTFIAGDGDDLDAQAARDAACDLLDAIFGNADAWEELASVGVDEEALADLLERFLALYIYNRVPVVAERLSRLADPVAMRQADQEMRQVIGDLVAIRLPEEPLSVDWQGDEGRAIAEDAMESAYRALSELEREEQS